jgi:hypothetical protein
MSPTTALRWGLLGLVASTLAVPAMARADGVVTSRGELAVESRAFRDDGSPLTADRGLGLLGRVEARHQHAPFEEKLRAFGRLDHFDDRRSVFILEEAWLQARTGRARLRLGADVVNWTATEAFHPADVVNARNLDSDLESLEKVGEPMAALQVGLLQGMTASALFMPVYMATRFPSPASRLGFGPGMDMRGRRLMVDRQGRFTRRDFGPQGAVRLQQVVGSADLSVHALEQMDRLQPLVGLDAASGLPVPVFLTVRQVGGTWTQTLGALVIKVEGAYRWFQTPAATGAEPPAVVMTTDSDRDHAAVAVGFEYGLPHAGGGDSTFLVEGQGIFGPSRSVRAQLSPFENDVFVGYRLAIGDEDDKTFFLGGIVDLRRPRERLLTASYQQRLGETFTVAVGLRLFTAPPGVAQTWGIAALRDADHLRLTLTRHF